MSQNVDASQSRVRIFFSKIKWAMVRPKPLDHDSVLETPLNRNMNMLDILMYGIGAMLGNSIFGVTTVVMRNLTGTSTFLSFLIAGFAALLNALCYSELSSHIPRAGSAYAYTYVIAGEFLAFVTGWLMMLEYCLLAVSASISASYNLDILSNGTISTFLHDSFGPLGGQFGAGLYLNPYYNIPAFLFCILTVIIVSTGNTGSSSVNIFFSSVTVIVIAIATVFMFAKLNAHTVTLVTRPKRFLSHGVKGLLSGSGIAFNAFIGFDAISVAGEEARDPRRSIPLAINIAVVCVIVITIVHSLALALYVPWWHVNAELGLANVFNSPDSIWLRYTVGVGALLATTANLICCLYAIPRVAYSMADDGLIFSWLGWIWPRTKVPIVSLIIAGIFCAVLSLILKYSTVVSFLSAGTLIAYVFVACDVIILRFMKPELYKVSSNDQVGCLYAPFKRLTFLAQTRFGFVVTVALSVYTSLCLITLVYLWKAYPLIFHGYWWTLLLTVLFITALVICVVVIAMHRHHEGGEYFRIPFIPFVPLLCIFVDINLIIRLPGETWVRVGIWLILGMFMYFGYGMRKSKLVTLAKLKDQYLDLTDATVEGPEALNKTKSLEAGENASSPPSSQSRQGSLKEEDEKNDEKKPILSRPSSK